MNKDVTFLREFTGRPHIKAVMERILQINFACFFHFIFLYRHNKPNYELKHPAFLS
jgi:hypothetical protein